MKALEILEKIVTERGYELEIMTRMKDMVYMLYTNEQGDTMTVRQAAIPFEGEGMIKVTLTEGEDAEVFYL